MASATVLLVLLVLVGAGLLRVLTRPVAVLSASSGTGAARLLTASQDGARVTTWRSNGETVGTTLSFVWPRPQVVDHILLRAPSSRSIESTLAEFGDGSSLLLSANSRGDVESVFPARKITQLRLVVSDASPGVTSVSLSSLRVDGAGATVRAEAANDTTGGREVSASTSADGTSPDFLAAGGGRGAGWMAAPRDGAPWVQLSWPTARQVTSVRLAGPLEVTSAPSRGVLRFSDGSVVPVGAVRGADAPPTIVGFAPRMVTSVRFVMTGRSVGLRGFDALGVGSTPAGVQATAGHDLVEQPAADCSSVVAPAPVPATLTLICPTTGVTVNGRFSIAVAGPADRDVTVETFQPFPGSDDQDQGVVQVVQHSRTSSSGVARFQLDSGKLPNGPVNLAIRMPGLPTPLAVQVLNTKGTTTESPAPSSSRRTLLWNDEFSGRLSASVGGTRTVYAATKPERTGGSQFGDAIFADPSWNSGNLGTVAGGYLRLRLSPKSSTPQAANDSRTQIGGLLSSAAIGGGGTSAQYGFFEARILGAPGLGTWPAFWMLSNPTLVSQTAASGEVDAVELYGTDTTKACHAVHSYSVKQSTVRCLPLSTSADWSLQWHTYGVDIEPDASRFYVDGRLVTTMKGPSNASDPYFFLLNLASGGGWPVDLSPTGGISDMYVDWVRVYT